jgi:membrane-associated phospholipid phosphatase
MQGSADPTRVHRVHRVRPARRPGAGPPLAVALLCLAGLAATWAVAALVPVAHLHDASTLYDFTRLDGRPRIDRLASWVLGLLEPQPYFFAGVLLVSAALLRRRPRVALAVAVVLALAPLSAELLKPLLAHPHADVGLAYVKAASWPSGHATAAMALALCAVLVSPRWLRPPVAVGGLVFVFAVSCALLILAWHMPSDVAGGWLLASLWVALAMTVLRLAQTRWPAPRSAPLAARAGVRVSGRVRPGLPQ